MKLPNLRDAPSYMSVTCDTDTLSESAEAVCMSTSVYMDASVSRGNLAKQVREGLLLPYFVDEETEAQR